MNLFLLLFFFFFLLRFDTDNNSVTPLMFAVQYCGVVRLRKEEPWAKYGATIQELLRGGASGGQGHDVSLGVSSLVGLSFLTFYLGSSQPLIIFGLFVYY